MKIRTMTTILSFALFFNLMASAALGSAIDDLNFKAPELRDELERLALPFTDDVVPSDAELRIAQAQLVGWLEGLFHGIQTALFAQQMAARAQLEQMRQGALPPGMSIGAPHSPAHPDQQSPGTGQYL